MAKVVTFFHTKLQAGNTILDATGEYCGAKHAGSDSTLFLDRFKDIDMSLKKREYREQMLNRA